MRKLICAAALLGTVSATRAAVFYEPFDYAPGDLHLNVNPNGQTWYSSASSGAADRVQVVSGSLDGTGFGLPASVGNRVSYGGDGRTDRIFLGTNYNSGTVFYSLLFKVSDLTGTPAGGATIMGFNNTAQAAGNDDTAGQPTAISGRLLVKPIPATTTFQVGASKASGSAGDFVFTPLGTPFAQDELIHIVGRYTFVAGALNDTFDMWVNPPAGTLGDDLLMPAPTLTATGGADGGQIATFIERQTTAIVPLVIQSDELRVDVNWHQATSNQIPEPASIGLLATSSLGLARRRRA